MANEDLGTLICPLCKQQAAVRKYNGQKRKGLYWNCQRCGVFMPTLPFAQGWILDNMTAYGPEGAPDPADDVAPPPAPEPAPAPPAPPPTEEIIMPKKEAAPAPAPKAKPAPKKKAATTPKTPEPARVPKKEGFWESL